MTKTTAASTRVPVPIQLIAGPTVLLEIAVEEIDAVVLSHDQHGDNLDRSGRALLAHAGVGLATPEGADRLWRRRRRRLAAGYRRRRAPGATHDGSRRHRRHSRSTGQQSEPVSSGPPVQIAVKGTVMSSQPHLDVFIGRYKPIAGHRASMGKGEYTLRAGARGVLEQDKEHRHEHAKDRAHTHSGRDRAKGKVGEPGGSMQAAS